MHWIKAPYVSAGFLLITFNYDIALDWALYFNSVKYDYCLSDQVEKEKIKYIKLHGSLNWGRCPICKKIFPTDFAEYWGIYFAFPPLPKNTGKIQIDVGSKIGRFVDTGSCQSNFEEVPVLVPPTWNKTDIPGQIMTAWKHAAVELSEAENLFVIGYSLPQTDLFFKYLLGLGTINPERRLKKFWVFNPDEQIKERYEEIKGQGIEDFQFFPKTFEESLPVIKSAFNIKV